MSYPRAKYNYEVMRGRFSQPVEEIISGLEGREVISTETYKAETYPASCWAEIRKTLYIKHGVKMVAFQVVRGNETGYDNFCDYFACPIEKQPSHEAILAMLNF